MVEDWSIITIGALQSAWGTFVAFLPKLLGAIIVFIIGWFLALGIGKLIAEILNKLKFNKLFANTGWQAALEKAELKVNPSEFIGAICKWILVVVFLMISADILGWAGFVNLLEEIVNWLPNLIIAIAIFIVAIIIADILKKIVEASVEKLGVNYAKFFGEACRWAIYIFSGLIILRQLGVTPTIIDSIVAGLVGMLALSFGLAFGLGGKDNASQLIENLKKKISK